MDKVTIFGAGHVGATAAFYIALSGGLEVALCDVVEGKAAGLALDIEQALPYTGSVARVEGGADPGIVEGSDLVVVTAGFPREPGMSRLDLTVKNAPIVAGIADEVARHAPDAVVVVVSNPVDEMTYLTLERSGFPERRVMGMAGVLDTSRFMYFLASIGGLPAGGFEALVLGTHGDDMVPLTEWSRHGDGSLSEALESGVLEECVERTRKAGEEIVGYLRTGSAYFAPAVSIGVMARAILGDTGEVLPASAYLTGEYGIEGVFLGVPARLGRAGIVEVVELPLSEGELAALGSAAGGVKERVKQMSAVYGDDGP